MSHCRQEPAVVTNKALCSITPSLAWIADAAFYSTVPVALLVHLAQRRGIRPRDYGLGPVREWGALLATSLTFAVVLGASYFATVHVSWGLLHLVGLEAWTKPFFSYGAAIPTGWLHAPTVAYLAVSAGLLESIFFLGLPRMLWRERFGRAREGAFVMLSACAFALVHWEQGGVGTIAALAFGLLAAALYRKTTDLWPIVLAHTLIDLVAY